MVTAIINIYKRVEHLPKLIKALEKQSISPKYIWIWYNKPENEEFKKLDTDYPVFYSTNNFKFHARFAIANLARTKYIAVFDDDTIPAVDWFKSCLETVKTHDGILGTTGVIFQQYQYTPNTKIGWNGYKNPTPVEVDLVGHAWFFKKEYLKYMFDEEPLTWDTGEDIQFSCLAYKNGGIKTYVPPHDNQLKWGSIEGNIGNDENATWLSDPSQVTLRNMIVNKYIKDGYKPVKERNTL